MPRSAIVLIAMLWTLCPALALAEEKPDERVVELQRETAYLNAQAEAEKARAALIASKVAPLTAFAGEGKTTLGTGAGTPEAWFLARQAITFAAAEITKDLVGEHIVVLAGDETLNLSLPAVLSNEISSLNEEFAESIAGAGQCAPRPDASPALVAGLGAVASLLKSDVEVQGLEVKADHRLLATAVASALGSRALIPSAMKIPDLQSSNLAGELRGSRKLNNKALAARACIGDNKKMAGAAKALDASTKRYSDFMQRISAADTNGKSQLVDALVAEAINSTSPTILRVYVEKAGGTLLSHKNLLTAFGKSPVTVSGGLIASYIATNPVTGTVVKAGTIGCATQQQSLRSASQQAAPIMQNYCSI